MAKGMHKPRQLAARQKAFDAMRLSGKTQGAYKRPGSLKKG